MGEVSKAVGQWIVANVDWSVIIFLFILSGLFKVVKIEINPIGWLIGCIGKALTKDVRNDISKLQTETNAKFEEIKADRAISIQDLKSDYDTKITALKTDLDNFELSAKTNLCAVRTESKENCSKVSERLDKMERSNDMQTVRQIKAHVLDFANSCLNGVKHTKQDFDNIIKENEEYEELVKQYGLRNDVYTEDYKFIMKIYHECQEKHSFLKSEDI